MSFVYLTVAILIFALLLLNFFFEGMRTWRETRRRNRLSVEEREQEARWVLGGSFNMRRPDSALRSRHVHKERPRGQTANLNKPQRDPYAP